MGYGIYLIVFVADRETSVMVLLIHGIPLAGRWCLVVSQYMRVMPRKVWANYIQYSKGTLPLI
jgi:hypothetical protein